MRMTPEASRSVGIAAIVGILAICAGMWLGSSAPATSDADVFTNEAPSSVAAPTVPVTPPDAVDAIGDGALPPAVLGPVVTAAEPILGEGKGEHDYPGPRP